MLSLLSMTALPEPCAAHVIRSRTVATHVEHILDKLEAPNRAAAASYALREGYILGRVECPGRSA